MTQVGCWYCGRRQISLHWGAQLCGLLLLHKGLPALEGLVTGSSAAMGMARPLRSSGDGSIEEKAERDLLM
jgi:hypothetical protein